MTQHGSSQVTRKDSDSMRPTSSNAKSIRSNDRSRLREDERLRKASSCFERRKAARPCYFSLPLQALAVRANIKGP